jgi:hypothetical protein
MLGDAVDVEACRPLPPNLIEHQDATSWAKGRQILDLVPVVRELDHLATEDTGQQRAFERYVRDNLATLFQRRDNHILDNAIGLPSAW